MSDDVSATEHDWAQAREANVLRQQGQTTRALERYDEVIAAARARSDGELLAHGYAGRGAVKMALGFYSAHDPDLPALPRVGPDERTPGAIEDLVRATTLSPNNGWAWAQLGEAHRSFARDFFRIMPETRFHEHVDEALGAFEKATERLREQQAWLLAHTAATHFLAIWRAYDIDTARLPDLSAPPRPTDPPKVREAKAHRQKAEKGFRDAIAANPNYAWAKRFLAYLLTIVGGYEEAPTFLTSALLDDPRVELPVIRSMSMLYRYQAEAGDVRDDEQRRQLLQLALRAGQQAMERDPEDFFAIYAHAAAGAALRAPDAKQICREARGRILNQAVRAIALARALHERSGGTKQEFALLLGDAIGNVHKDTELIALAHHDPVWTKSPGGGEGKRDNLLKQMKEHFDELLPGSDD